MISWLFRNTVQEIVDRRLIEKKDEFNDMKESLRLIKWQQLSMIKQLSDMQTKICTVDKKIVECNNNIDVSIINSRDLPVTFMNTIDRYAEKAIHNITSQGAKCSSKISNKEQAVLTKLLDKHHQIDGQMKREIPILKEHILLINDKISAIEDKINMSELVKP